MKHESIQEIFDRAAAQFGPLPAIERGGDALSYEELARRSNRLANFLVASGLRPGARIAVLTEDVFDVVTAMLASFKARCVYVPLDPSAPEKRLAALAADVTPEVFVTEPGLVEVVGRTARGARAVCLGGGGTDAEGVTLLRGFESFADAGDPGLAPEPDDTCYVYFTSGSTGRPKGIAGRLKAVSHFIRWETRELGLGEGVRVSQLVSTTFDAFLRDVFVPLSVGGTVCAPPDREALLDPAALVTWLDRARVNLVHCVPSQFRVILSGGLEPGLFEALRHVLLSGEPLLPSDVRRWTAVFGDRVRLVNLYGPTETTMTKFFYFVKPSDAERAFVPIGQPMPGARAILLDERGHPCPPGAVGEIYIRTPFRSHGYWNRPDLTREVFVQNPFGQDPQDVIYKTGDLARVHEDGNFQILGRKDQQVKIRGVRVELTEVEGLLREHEAVADAAVAARTDPSGFDYLCAYVAPKSPVESRELHAFLAAQLPAHTLPSSFVFVESLPLTPSGKLDRQALVSLDGGRGAAHVAPRTDLERKLVEIWQEVLGQAGLGVSDNFFEVGGHSLVAMRAVSRIHKELNARVELREFFANPTVETLALLIGSSRPAEYVEIQPVPERPFYEVSNAQRRLWVLSQLEAELRAYNMCAAYVLEGALDAAAFGRAFAALVERHESLRTTFAEVEGRPVQRVHPAAGFPFEVERADLRGRPDAERAAAAAANRAAATVFDLARGPLLRARLLRLADERHLFVLTMHHIISDGWSMGVLVNEVLANFKAFSRGEESPLPPLRIQYRDYAAWQHEELAGDRLEAHQRYWHGQFADEAPALALSTDFPRPAVKTYGGDHVVGPLGGEAARTAQRLGQEAGASLFMVLLAAVNALLYRYTSQEDIVVGSPIAGRDRKELEGQIGFYVNTLALRTRPAGRDTFAELLEKVKATTLAAYEHQIYPFDRLVDELRLRRDASRSPLFDVLVVLQNMESGAGPAVTVEGLSARDFEFENPVSKYDLSFRFWELRGELYAEIVYNADLFRRETIERMHGHLRTLFAAAVARPGERVSRLPLLTERERRQLAEWNDTDTPFPAESCVHELFERQARLTPDAAAVEFESGRLSYAELNREANRLAHLLRASGVGPDVLVAIALERSPEMIVALLGVLKAGGAYVPLDPSYPRERLAYMLADATPRVLITTSGLSAKLPPYTAGRVLFLDEEAGALARESGENPAASSGAKNLAYVINTSGSTGRPKGTMIEHASLTNYILWVNRGLADGALPALPLVTSLSFDASLKQIFAPLLRGAAVWLPCAEALSRPERLLGELAARPGSGLNCVPTLWAALLDALESGACALPEGSLTHLLLGGERLSPELVARTFDALPGLHIRNLYGPTEATANATSARVRRGAEITIGRPIDNATAYILDEAQRRVAVGVAGELCIGGTGVARGYLNRPALTAERFIPDPFGGEAGARLYRTGDVARYLADGNIEFLGRADNQVKVRGFRVELGEVEAALRAHEAVRDCCVVVVAESAALPGEHVARPPVLTEEEQRRLRAWNETTVERPREVTLHGHFEEQVRRTPDAVAVVCEGRSLTYAELNRRANRVAHALRERGVGPDERVGVCLERSPELVVALLAAMKAGGCYVPLDPDYPAERLLYMLGDARVSVLLTSGALFPHLPAEARRTPCLVIDSDESLKGLPDDDPRGGAAGENLAYVIYTSGSTGRPKGVCVSHRSLVNYTLGVTERLGLSGGLSFALVSTPAADLGHTALFPSLCTGGRLHVVSRELAADAAALADYFERHAVDCLKIVPSHLSALLADGDAAGVLPRRRLVLGGEASGWGLVRKALSLVPGCSVFNHYGPTETTVGVLTYAVGGGVEGGEAGCVPLGRPLPNARVYVLDAHLNPVPVGAAGELHVGGAGLARGYLDRPGATAERFIPDPLSGEAGARLYRTGDLARHLPDGNVEFLGRADDQVKVRGFRVELGEVEAALRAHEAVRDCVAVAREDEAGAHRLVAYVVFADSAARPSAGELRAFLQTTLPEHMTPALFVTLERMPLMPNGKVDRAALPRPDAAASVAEYVEPSGEVEGALAVAWQAVLGLERVGARDNYFDLGGDSMRAIRIASLLQRQGLELRVRHLFQFPTVESLAPHVRRLRRIADQSAVVGPVTPTPTQADFLETVSPGRRHHFGQSAMLHAPGGFDAEALSAVFAKLYEHHDALRLRLRPDTLTLFNEDATAPPRLDVYDLRGEADPAAALASKAEEAQASLNVEAGPLIRAALFRLPDGDRLLLALHQLVVDDLSWRILFEDIRTLYRQHADGEPLALPRKTDSFKAWTERLVEYANSAEFLAERDYWERVEATTVPPIERDGGDGVGHVADEQAVSFALTAEETELLLTRVNNAFNTETRDILLSALGLAAAGSFGHARIAVAVEGHGREAAVPDVDVDRTVGWFASVYPVVLDLSDAADPSKLIKGVKETMRRVPHHGIGHGLLKRLTRPEHRRGVRFGLRPQITFNYRGPFDAALDGLSIDVAFEARGRLRDPRAARADELGVGCAVEGGRLRASVGFSPGQHRPEKVEEFVGRYREALLGLIEHCSSRETAELTPSDLTYKGLSAEALDQLFN